MQLIITIISIRIIFSICLLVETKSKKNILKNSIKLTKKRFFKIILGLLILSLGVNFFFEGFQLIINYLATNLSINRSLLSFLENILINFSNTLLATLTVGYIVSYYFEINEVKNSENVIKSSLYYRLSVTFTIIIFLLINYLTIPYIDKNKTITAIDDLLVVAHRGSSFEEIENTYRAFDLAVKDKADIIELDVQLTKSGEIVVFHDSNLKRLIGIDKNTIDLTSKDLNEITFSPDYDSEYYTEKLPTLDDVISKYKNKINFMIELKPNIETPDLEEKVVEVINKNQLSNTVFVKSLNLDSVLEVEKLNSKIKTGYILSYAFSDYKTDYDILDFFSIEQTSLDFSLIKTLAEYKKDIFVWTVNSKDELLSVAEYKIKGIITDKPSVVNEYIFEERKENENK